MGDKSVYQERPPKPKGNLRDGGGEERGEDPGSGWENEGDTYSGNAIPEQGSMHGQCAHTCDHCGIAVCALLKVASSKPC